MTSIYVLKCQEGKYYVGKTDKTAMERFKEHTAGKGSVWTRKYKPSELIECFHGDKFDEDKKTKQYMDKYGIENVRGGAYSQIKLDEASLAALKREMNGANDKCNKCGNSGHFAKYCKAEKKCTRCNREGHTEKQCYATTYEEEEMIKVWICTDCNKEFDTKKGAIYHERFHCRKKKKKSSKCKRCGRNSHYASNCYASSHVKGYYLED